MSAPQESARPALAGKVALVTGGRSGIGRAVVNLFLEQGATVYSGDIAAPSASAEPVPHRHELALDVASEESWASFVDRVGGRADVLVNCAGIQEISEIEQTSVASFRRIFEVNQLGTFLGMKHAIPLLRASGGGSIINVSSTSGLRGNQGSVAYGGTKWAVRGMTKVAAIELAALGIRVNSVHPGFVSTELTDRLFGASSFAQRATVVPMGRAAQPEEIAATILFLASDAASYCTGAEFVCDGGLTAGTSRRLPGGDKSPT